MVPAHIPLTRRDTLKGLAAIAIASTGASWTAAAAEISPTPDSWISFRNGLTNPGIATSELPDTLELLWEIPTPDGTASTPVIADGFVYAGTLSGDLHCIELTTGKIVWTYRSVEMVDPNSFAPGFNAALALDSQRVYVGDDMGTFHAIDRQTGQRQWTVETNAEIVGGAQVIGERVIFGSHDGFLYCMVGATGEQVWKVETHGPVNGTPCISGKETFTTGCDKPILRIIDLEVGKQTDEIELGELLIASAAFYDGVLYFGTDGGTVHALDWKTKKKVWEFSVPNREQQIHSSPAVTADVVVIGTRDKLVYCFDRQTGAVKWSVPTRGRVDSSPVISGQRVYFGGADKTLYCVNLTDGAVVWKIPTRQGITGSPAIAAGHLVIGTETSQGRILCFGAKRK